MRSLYAASFTVTDASLAEVVSHIHDWIGTIYNRTHEDAVPQLQPVRPSSADSGADPAAGEVRPADAALSEATTWEPESQHAVRTRTTQGAEQALYELTWRHPSHSPEARFVEQRTVKALRRPEGGVLVEVQSTADTETFRIAPFDAGTIQRPRIVDRLVDRWCCTIDGTRVQSYPLRIREADARSFVADTLLSPERALPVVTLSHDPDQQRPVRDPEWVQDRVIGLANVVEITPAASKTLTEHVGRARSCYNGFVRIFWPGFTRRSDPKDHPYFDPVVVEARRRQGKELEDLLFERITEAAAERFRESDAVRAFRREMRRARMERIRERQADIPDEWIEDHEQTLAENERLRDEVERWKKDYENLLQNLRQIRRAAPDAEGPGGDVSVPEPDEIESAAEALRIAEVKYGDRIYVWKSAEKAIAKTSYHDPAELFRTLEAIADLAEVYAERDGETGPWRQHFDDQGIKYTPHESEPTMNQYGDQRRFHDGGEKVQMERHVTIGQAHDHSLQIYFQPGEEDDRFQIGYCGEHLPTVTHEK